MIITSTARASELTTAGQENNPFLAWDNLGAAGTLSGTATLSGGPASNAMAGTTYDFWLPDVTTTTANLSVDLGTAANISFAGIAAHNLSDFGATVRIRNSSDGVSWSDAGAGPHTPTDNSPIAFRMDTSGNSFQHWQLYVTGLTAGDAVAVGVFFLGNDTVIPRRFYQSFSPVLTPTEVVLQSSVSQGGHLLGSSVIRQGSTLQAVVEHIPATFIRGASWLDFQTSFNKGKPAFFGWRPDKYAQDVHYIWNAGPIRPQPSGTTDLMNVEMNARVYEP